MYTHKYTKTHMCIRVYVNVHVDVDVDVDITWMLPDLPIGLFTGGLGAECRAYTRHKVDLVSQLSIQVRIANAINVLYPERLLEPYWDLYWPHKDPTPPQRRA